MSGSSSTPKEMLDIVVLDGILPLKEKYPRESLTKANGWEECPIPTMLGIPLMAKPIRPYPGGNFPDQQFAVFMMVEPIKGMAPCRWQLGPRCNLGMIGFGRRDGKPFSIQQWADLHSFIYDLCEIHSEQESDKIISGKINVEYYKKYLRNIESPLAGQEQAPVYLCSRCELVGLKKCSRCRCTYYCSQECQAADWKEIHSKKCCKFFYDREDEKKWLDSALMSHGIPRPSTADDE